MSLTEITRAQAREIDRRAIAAGMSSLVLMENAARGAVDTLARLGIAGPVLICCGPGNNGGDGLAMARLLDARGYKVRLALWGHDDKLSADAAANLRLIPHTGVSLTRFAAKDLTQLEALIQGVDWIVDALFGTGFRGAPRAPFEEVIRSINDASAKKLAVDLPSGLDADTGQPGNQPSTRSTR